MGGGGGGMRSPCLHSRGGRLTTEPPRRSSSGDLKVQRHHSCPTDSLHLGSRRDPNPQSLDCGRRCCRRTDRTHLQPSDRLDGLVVKAPASRAEDPGFESRLRRNFSGSSHTSDSKIGTPVATLQGAWRYRVSAGNSRPGVSIL